MTTVIINLLILASFLSMQTVVLAQDMLFQAPLMGNMGSLGMTEIKTDILAPLTMKVNNTYDDYFMITWRGTAMHYNRVVEKTDSNTLALHVDRAVFNVFCKSQVVDEEQMIRQAWTDALGVDVWHPYYQVKKVQGWIKKKASVRIFKLKGEPIIEKGRLMYCFKTTF
jgi:hypothetical protein